MLRPGDFGMNEFSYPDSKELKKFHRKNKLTNCILNQVFSPQAASIFFRDLAYDSQDIGRCISLIPNAIAITLLNKYGKDSELSCIEKIGNGELIAAVCNNEATNHGSNLNAMVSYIKYNDDSSYDIHIINSPKDLVGLNIKKYILEKYIQGEELRYLTLNGKVINHVNDDCRGEDYCFGLISFTIPQGQHMIKVQLKDTSVRTIGNIITLVSFFIVVFSFAKNALRF